MKALAAKNATTMRSVLLLICLAMAGCSGEKLEFSDGSFTDLSHWDERWLIINYWAEWCAPCREEIPELNELHRDRTATGIVVVGVNYDGLVNPALTEVAAALGVDFPVLLHDPMVRFGYPRTERLPMTVILNPKREVVEILEGPQTRKRLEFIVSTGAGLEAGGMQ